MEKERISGSKKEDDYRAKDYHRPSDQVTSEWNFDGAIEDLKLLFMVGKQVATSEKWPAWKEGSEFKKLREPATASR